MTFFIKMKKYTLLLFSLLSTICALGEIYYSGKSEFQVWFTPNFYTTIPFEQVTEVRLQTLDSSVGGCTPIPSRNTKGHILKYNSETKEAVVTRISGSERVVIPCEILYSEDSTVYTVTELAARSGAYDGMKYVFIPNTIKTIGDSAFFDCSSLEEVVIASPFVSIGDSAFVRCPNLKKVTLPESATYTQSSFGDDVTLNFEENPVFPYDLLQTEVVVSLKEEDDRVFNATEVDQIVLKLPEAIDLDSTCPVAQSDIPFFKFNYSDYSATFSGYSNDKDTVCEIPCALINNGLLYKVTSLSINALMLNRNLKSVVIPRFVSSLGSGCISNAYRIEELVVSSENKTFCSVDGVIYSKDTTKLICCPPAKKNITIPNTVTVIGKGAFEHCTLKNIVLPNSVTRIEEMAFYYCDIESIDLPNSVTTLDRYAFESTRIKSIKIPASVTSIEKNVFAYCRSLESIEVSEDNPKYASYEGCLYTKNLDTLIYIPEKKSSIEFPSEVSVISSDAFGRSTLKSLELPNTIKKIEDRAFSSMNNLKSIRIPDFIDSLDAGVFNGCSSLDSIIVSEDNKKYTSVDGILLSKDSTVLIAYPSGRDSINIPSCVKSIGSRVFSYLDYNAYYEMGMEDFVFVLPNTIEHIGDYAFEGAYGIKKIVLPESLRTFGKFVFAYCSFSELEIPESVEYIDRDTFIGCYFGKVVVSRSTKIAEGAFDKFTEIVYRD